MPGMTEQEKNPLRGLFFCELEGEHFTDSQIIDEMLQHEKIITAQLAETGVIRIFMVCDKPIVE